MPNEQTMQVEISFFTANYEICIRNITYKTLHICLEWQQNYKMWLLLQRNYSRQPVLECVVKCGKLCKSRLSFKVLIVSIGTSMYTYNLIINTYN